MTRNPNRFHDRIKDALEAIGNVRSDLGGMSKAEFLAEGKMQRAIIDSSIVVGETATKAMQINPRIQRGIPALWQHFRDACDLWNILMHEYFRVDAAIVWTYHSRYPQPLEAQLRELGPGSYPIQKGQ